MSLLLGQSGSLERDDFVQPPLQTLGPNIVAKGSFLQPGPYGSVSIDDRSRFRNTSFVPPQSIELMTGFMNYGFYTGNPNNNDSNAMPRQTYIAQDAAFAPSLYYSTTPSLSAPAGRAMNTQPYGLEKNGPVSSQRCPPGVAYINASGACQVPSSSPLYNPDGRNVYF
jgi:hypothetical protein